MKTTNYFRSDAGTYFFDDTHLTSALSAWQNANQQGLPTCVWKPFGLKGPWTGCNIVGYSTSTDLRHNIRTAWLNAGGVMPAEKQLDLSALS